MNKKYIQIKESFSGLRLDQFLVQKIDSLSRNQIQNFIKKSKILVNDKAVKTGFILQEGDIIEIHSDIYNKKSNVKIIPINIDLDIIYEDENIVGINKKSGLVVHPGIKNEENTLVHGLEYRFKNLSDINGHLRKGIVHRLDADTSGIILVAKNNKAHKWLSSQFKDRKIIKEYIAITWGNWNENEGKISGDMIRSKTDPTKYVFAKDSINGRYSESFYKVEKQYTNHSKVRFYPRTGRTHQIRVHSSYLGNPIFGDHKYGGDIRKAKEYKPSVYKYFSSQLKIFTRHALHAYSIEFINLYKKRKIKIIAPIPDEFIDLEKSLSEYENQS